MRQVLITGASSDIGLALCRTYRNAGWRVLAHYNRGRAEFEALTTSDSNIIPMQLDFAAPDALSRGLEPFEARLLECDALVTLAAVMPSRSFLDASPEDVLKVLSANLLPGIVLSQRLGQEMVKRGWGRIVHGSSIGTKFGGGSDSYLYSLSKHCLEFIPAEVRSWASSNVLTNVARIGVTDTRGHDNFPSKNLADRVVRIPAKRMASPSEIADTLYWLGSEQNSYVSGQLIDIAGGE